MKRIKTLIATMIGLSLLLAVNMAFADGKQRPGAYYSADHSWSKYHHPGYQHEKQVYVDRHVYMTRTAPRYAWGYYPSYPHRVVHSRVYREYCGPYDSTYTYGHVYRPGWSFGISFGW